jgi:hypothetical protein
VRRVGSASELVAISLQFECNWNLSTLRIECCSPFTADCVTSQLRFRRRARSGRFVVRFLLTVPFGGKAFSGKFTDQPVAFQLPSDRNRFMFREIDGETEFILQP